MPLKILVCISHEFTKITDCKSFKEKLQLNDDIMYNWPNGARPKSSSANHRKLSDNVELPKNYPRPQQNGQDSTSNKTDLLVSVQNLPAVLTDPRKGKLSINDLAKTTSILWNIRLFCLEWLYTSSFLSVMSGDKSELLLSRNIST